MLWQWKVAFRAWDMGHQNGRKNPCVFFWGPYWLILRKYHLGRKVVWLGYRTYPTYQLQGFTTYKLYVNSNTCYKYLFMNTVNTVNEKIFRINPKNIYRPITPGSKRDNLRRAGPMGTDRSEFNAVILLNVWSAFSLPSLFIGTMNPSVSWGGKCLYIYV
jgi:hypothetical protein